MLNFILGMIIGATSGVMIGVSLGRAAADPKRTPWPRWAWITFWVVTALLLVVAISVFVMQLMETAQPRVP